MEISNNEHRNLEEEFIASLEESWFNDDRDDYRYNYSYDDSKKEIDKSKAIHIDLDSKTPEERKIALDENSKNTPDILLKIQDDLLKNSSNLKDINVKYDDINERIEPDTYLKKLNNSIDSITQELKNFELIDERLDLIKELHEKKAILNEKLSLKREQLDNRINETFAKISNKVHEKQKITSDIKPKLFDKLNASLNLTNPFKNIFKKVFKSKNLNKSEEQKQHLNNTLYNKLKLKEKINEKLKNALNINPGSADPDKLAEEILMSLFYPVKVAAAQELSNNKAKDKDNLKNTLNSSIDINKTIEKVKPLISVNINNKEHSFLGYSEDKKFLILKNSEGKKVTLLNNESTQLKFNETVKLNPLQKDLLDKGKTLNISVKTDTGEHNIVIKKNKSNSTYDLSPITPELEKRTISVIDDHKEQKKNSIKP